MLCITLELILPLTFFLAMFLNFSFVFLIELVFRVTTQLFCLLMKSLQNPKYLSVHNLKYGSIGCLNKYCLKQKLPSDPPALGCSCPIGWHICFLVQLNSHKMADLSVYPSTTPHPPRMDYPVQSHRIPIGWHIYILIQLNPLTKDHLPVKICQGILLFKVVTTPLSNMSISSYD